MFLSFYKYQAFSLIYRFKEISEGSLSGHRKRGKRHDYENYGKYDHGKVQFLSFDANIFL